MPDKATRSSSLYSATPKESREFRMQREANDPGKPVVKEAANKEPVLPNST